MIWWENERHIQYTGTLVLVFDGHQAMHGGDATQPFYRTHLVPHRTKLGI